MLVSLFLSRCSGIGLVAYVALALGALGCFRVAVSDGVFRDLEAFALHV